MGVILMLMTIGGLILAALLLVVALITKSYRLAKFVAAGVGIWTVLIYAPLLIGVSLLSSERTLAFNEPKEFCGFYLDCHMHSEVTGVRREATIGEQVAKGKFYTVNLKVFSDAKNPNVSLRLITPRAVVLDGNGKTYERDLTAESGLPTGPIDLGSTIHNKQTIEKEIVFDLPADVQSPRLDVTEGYGIDHFIESLLVGDEDSIFHKRTYFRLPEQTLAQSVE